MVTALLSVWNSYSFWKNLSLIHTGNCTQIMIYLSGRYYGKSFQKNFYHITLYATRESQNKCLKGLAFSSCLCSLSFFSCPRMSNSGDNWSKEMWRRVLNEAEYVGYKGFYKVFVAYWIHLYLPLALAFLSSFMIGLPMVVKAPGKNPGGTIEAWYLNFFKI